MNTSRLQAPLALLLASALATPRALAQDDRAAALYDRATASLRAGKAAEAAAGFEEAWRARPHAAPLVMAATAWETAGQPSRAADALARALDEAGLASDRRERVRRQLASLEADLGTVVVAGPRTVRVRVGDGAAWPLPARLHAPPGTHAVEARDERGAVALEHPRVVRLERGQVVTVAVQIPPPSSLPSPPEQPSPASKPSQSAGPTIALALGGAGVAAIAAGFWMWGRANETKDRFDETPTWELRDQGIAQVRWANGLWIAGGAALIGGLAWYVAPRFARPEASVAWTIAPDGTIWAQGHF